MVYAISNSSESHNRLGNKVDQSKIQLGQLYTVLSPAHGQHAPNGGPVFNDIYGIGLDGGYAEYIIVKDFNVVPVVS